MLEGVSAELVRLWINKPRSDVQHGKLPVWLACQDHPVPTHGKQDLAMVTINDGRHDHAIGLNPPQSRLKADLGNHFATHQDLYVRQGFPL